MSLRRRARGFGELVPDAIFAERRLAAIYDVFDGAGDDRDAYLAIVAELDVHTLLCTGSLACFLGG